MAASWQQIRKADLVDFTEIGCCPSLACGYDARDVERPPTHGRDRELRVEKQCGVSRRRALAVVANEPVAVRELHDGAHDMKARYARDPTNAREPREIHVARL